jgi:hypothetical protein
VSTIAFVCWCTQHRQADQRRLCAVREAFITQQQQEHGGGEGEIELLAFRVKDAQIAKLFKEKFEALQKGVPIAATAAPKSVPVTADAAPKSVPVTADAAPKSVPVTADAAASSKVTQGANTAAEIGIGTGNGKDGDDESPLICRESFWQDEGVEGDCAPLMNRNAGFAKLGDEALLKRASRCMHSTSDPSQFGPENPEFAL